MKFESVQKDRTIATHLFDQLPRPIARNRARQLL